MNGQPEKNWSSVSAWDRLRLNDAHELGSGVETSAKYRSSIQIRTTPSDAPAFIIGETKASLIDAQLEFSCEVRSHG